MNENGQREKRIPLSWLAAGLLLLWPGIAPGAEQILARESREGLSLVVVAEEPEGVQPPSLTLAVREASHHIEALATFAEGNPYGGVPGSFFPYLRLLLTVRRAGEEVLRTRLIPLVHQHGPHYGANIRLPGRGRYRMTLRVEPPSEKDVGRHEDVKGWFSPFEVTFELVY